MSPRSIQHKSLSLVASQALDLSNTLVRPQYRSS